MCYEKASVWACTNSHTGLLLPFCLRGTEAHTTARGIHERRQYRTSSKQTHQRACIYILLPVAARGGWLSAEFMTGTEEGGASPAAGGTISHPSNHTWRRKERWRTPARPHEHTASQIACTRSQMPPRDAKSQTSPCTIAAACRHTQPCTTHPTVRRILESHPRAHATVGAPKKKLLVCAALTRAAEARPFPPGSPHFKVGVARHCDC